MPSDPSWRSYAYLPPRPAGRGRARYVPGGLPQVVRRYLRRGEQAEAAPALTNMTTSAPGGAQERRAQDRQ